MDPARDFLDLVGQSLANVDDVHAAVVHAVREQGVDVALLLADTCEAISDLVVDVDADPDRDAMIGVLTTQAGTLQAIGINLAENLTD